MNYVPLDTPVVICYVLATRHNKRVTRRLLWVASLVIVYLRPVAQTLIIMLAMIHSIMGLQVLHREIIRCHPLTTIRQKRDCVKFKPCNNKNYRNNSKAISCNKNKDK